MTDSDPVMLVRDLRMRYGALDVLTGVDFDVRRGEVLTLPGPNGAGKQTIVEILEGFRLRSDGDGAVLGADPATADEAWRSRIGVVLQWSRDHGKWHVGELLDHLGRYYAPYSTDERRTPAERRSAGRDGRSRPLSEPEHRDAVRGPTSPDGRRNGRRRTAGAAVPGRANRRLRPQARRDFHDLVRRLSGLEGTTILLTTHDLDEAERLAHRILILAGGRIVANGTSEELAALVTGQSEVRWRRDGERFVETTDDAVSFVRQLLAERRSAERSRGSPAEPRGDVHGHGPASRGRSRRGCRCRRGLRRQAR